MNYDIFEPGLWEGTIGGDEPGKPIPRGGEASQFPARLLPRPLPCAEEETRQTE